MTRSARVTRLRSAISLPVISPASFLSFCFSPFPFLSACLSKLSCLQFTLRCPHSTLPRTGCSFRRVAHRWSFSATVKRKETRYEESNSTMSTVSNVSSCLNCFFISFIFFFLTVRDTRAREFLLVFPFPPTPFPFSHGYLLTSTPMIPLTFAPVSLSLPHTLALTSSKRTLSFVFSLSLFFLSRLSFISTYSKGATFPLRRSYTRAPLLSLSIMTHTAWRKAAHPSTTKKDSPREQFADPSVRLAHDKRIRENPCTGVASVCMGACGSRVTYTSVTPTSMLGGW